MHYTLLNLKLVVIVFLLLIYSVTNNVCFAVENDERPFAYGSHIDISKNPETAEKENLQKFARIITNLLEVTRNIIALNSL
ncbi:MAG: hypothetical protein MRK02_02655 [Candidatus Scalindua sp.]|nr:hypothetical protein [Candidatus Scalindua sp.]